MFINDLSYILKWWFVILSIGIIFFPITWLIFKKFFGLGYALGKTLGIVLISYLVFLLSILKIAPFTPFSLYSCILIFLFLNGFIFYKNRGSIVKDLKSNIFKIIVQETLFAGGLLLWSYVRAHQPEIRGLEKFMDYGFINSILRGETLPPQDMWAAGHTINYYWFGHFVTAVLTTLSNIPSEITYNLMIASIMGLTISSAFVISSTLIQRVSKVPGQKLVYVAGIVSALVLTFGGNFHTPFYVLKNGSDRYWYPDATRFIGYNPETNDKTIHEFPMYSFVVSDLHGHLLNLPFVLLFLASAFAVVDYKRNNAFEFNRLLIPGFLLGTMFMTSTWDFGNYLLAFGFILLYSSLNENKFKIPVTLWQVGKTMVYTIAIGVVVSLPFIFNFESIAEGVRFVHSRTPVWQLLILWGFPLLLSVIFVTVVKKLGKKLPPSDLFILSLLTTSFFLIFLPELIYLKDIYAATHYRANTMFKLTYQAFVMSYLSAGYIITRQVSLETDKYVKRLSIIFWAVVLYSILMYADISTGAYYGKLKNYRGLDGIAWVQNQYPEYYETINWLKINAPKGSVLLEAPGDSYSDQNIVSSYTGIPTVSGWYVHEWLWRGSSEFPQKRVMDISNIYQAQNAQTAQNLLNKYNVTYVIVGAFEKDRFPSINEAVIKEIALPVFQSGTTTVYKLNNE